MEMIEFVLDDEQCLNMRRDLVSSGSSFLTSIISSLPCCSPVTMILPEVSLNTMTTLEMLLRTGYSDDITEMDDVIDLAGELGFDSDNIRTETVAADV